MNQTLAVQLTEFGPPEVMALREFDLPPPGAGEIRLRQTAIGFNYIDVYQRTGKYPLPTPTGLGHEAAGVVTAVGEGVADFRPGDRVVYMNAGIGAYATQRNIPAERAVRLPEGIDEASAAALFFKAMTAQYLLHKTYRVGPGDTVLVHAAAGGVGQILSAWAKALGATVIGTAGSPEKCAVARQAGCDAAVDYSASGWVERVIDAAAGGKASVVYDSVGRHTFMGSLDCARPFGHVVVFGAASGPIPPFDVELLNKKGCLYLTRPSVFPHNAEVGVFRANAQMVFDAYSRGIIRANIGARFPFSEVARAHAAAEARATTGAIVMVP
ncbi:quinone oxidoreductase family protein [Parapusillimonas granuli]|uniref:Quinone oxidoreductase n=1 Tax=Parapusillimonas granuli TaxID=380911 RepID=A0A853G5G6_9BURK|nr:quinone oxidoreductase [Parapusillimonas granuli]MBB5214313.1 NADPH2:quinone reductase [Parapusillimonas granuli]NYT51417.1 quinone oxidoreductase [Parapusillimonas granuli]